MKIFPTSFPEAFLLSFVLEIIFSIFFYCEAQARVGKDRQGMAHKAKGLKA